MHEYQDELSNYNYNSVRDKDENDITNVEKIVNDMVINNDNDVTD